MSTPSEPTTVLGTPLTSQERELLALYETTKCLVLDPELPPCVARNLRVSLAALWQVVNDLGLAYEPLYEYGV
ncbi:MAG TPA: hypothetical protein VKZ60_08550 [Chloroflexota bacterium]|jgi:hypothetical protein|nr:hypothetical protein [Chloroflexota bacterium]